MKGKLKKLNRIDEMRMDLAFRSIHMFSGHIRDLLILYGLRRLPDKDIKKMYKKATAQSLTDWGNSLN